MTVSSGSTNSNTMVNSASNVIPIVITAVVTAANVNAECRDLTGKASIAPVLPPLIGRLHLGLIDLEVERERLMKRIQEMEGRLAAVQKNLDNQNFLQRAPAEVVAHEREKQSAYQDRLNKLRENYQALV